MPNDINFVLGCSSVGSDRLFRLFPTFTESFDPKQWHSLVGGSVVVASPLLGGSLLPALVVSAVPYPAEWPFCCFSRWSPTFTGCFNPKPWNPPVGGSSVVASSQLDGSWLPAQVVSAVSHQDSCSAAYCRLACSSWYNSFHTDCDENPL